MQSNYKRLGEYITLVDKRNYDLKNHNLIGLSIQKKFIPSISNIIGTDMSTYRIINQNQFAYCPVTSRNGEKITVALYQKQEAAIISQAYTVFEITDTEKLLPEYLMMWFMRPEFDRYARYMSYGSVREIFSWEEMCNVLLPVPSIEKQQEIVKEYQVILNRIALNNRLIETLEQTAQAIYKHWFIDFEFPDENGNPYKSSGGEMEFNKELDKEIPKGWEVKKISDLSKIKGGKRLPKGESLNNEKNGRPYIKVADMCKTKFIVLNDKFEYVDDNLQKSISSYIVSKGDIILSIVGTIGLLNIIDDSLDTANLTENCVKLTNLKEYNIDYIYCFLSSSTGQREIEMKTVGGVQGKLPLYNIQGITFPYPNKILLAKYKNIITNLNNLLKVKLIENSNLLVMIDVLFSKLATTTN